MLLKDGLPLIECFDQGMAAIMQGQAGLPQTVLLGFRQSIGCNAKEPAFFFVREHDHSCLEIQPFFQRLNDPFGQCAGIRRRDTYLAELLDKQGTIVPGLHFLQIHAGSVPLEGDAFCQLPFFFPLAPVRAQEAHPCKGQRRGEPWPPGKGKPKSE